MIPLIRLNPELALILLFFLFCPWQTPLVDAAQQLPPNFFNQTGCLYVTTSDAGQYRVTFSDGAEQQTGPLLKLTYDSSTCMSPNKTGILHMSYAMNDNNFINMSLKLFIMNNPEYYSWHVPYAILKFHPVNSQLFPNNDELILHPAHGNEIYAPSDRSYSCSSLTLTNSSSGYTFRITLRRFQLQPFPEPQSRIFAASRDCSTWLTLPQIMGFILVLFMISTVFFGAYLLLELGGHSSDLRFSKQAGMLMNQAQLDATKAD